MEKTFIAKILKLLMMFSICIFFNSCKMANILVTTENMSSNKGDARQIPDMSIETQKIPILAWYGVQEHTVERYRELKECGIDHNLTLYMNEEQTIKAMNTAKEAEVKMFINCEGLDAELEKIVNLFKDHPAIAGYFICDEPNRNDFSRLGELVERIQAIDRKHICYVNILPANAEPKHIGIKTYIKYLQIFIKEVPVEILSFDHYPILLDASGKRFMSEWWYQSLEYISNEAHKAGKPFWAFALATAHDSYPIPTLADLRLQVYSNLAYGAQGIQYFTYWTPPANFGNFHDGPLDAEGQKTPTWYLVKQMNEEIKGLSDVFLGAQVIKIEHIVTNASGRNMKVPKGTKRFIFTKRPAEASIINKFNIPKNTNAVVSFLKNGNRAYMVVINRNLEGGDNASFTITGGASLQLIKKDGTAVPAYSENSKQTIIPGDALIYGWDIK